MVVEERNKIGDGPLKIDVVLPEGIVGVDRRVWAGKLLAPSFSEPIVLLGSAPIQCCASSKSKGSLEASS